MPDNLHNTEIRLVKRPVGKSAPDDFEQVDTPIPEPGKDQALVKVCWLSIDTYLHERAIGNAMGPVVPLGTRMPGRGVGTVVAGNLPAGTLVTGEFGWQRYAAVDCANLVPVPPGPAGSETLSLSALGVPGLTAWLALHQVLKPLAGQTLLVSSAAGTVGSILGQLAHQAGLNTIGIAGGNEKCAQLKALGFNVAIDRQTVHDWADALQHAAPDGIDLYMDNVGGPILEAVVQALNPRGKIVLCGHSAEYSGPAAQIATTDVLYKRICMQGLLVWDYAAHFDTARTALRDALASGTLTVRETRHEGLSRAPHALRAMLDGHGSGKHLVRVDTSL